MPRRVLMSTLVLQWRRRADMENDDSITDPEVKALGSEVYGEMWSEVALGSGQRYFETTFNITADGSTSYDEPDGHFSTVRLVRIAEDNREVKLRELHPGEEARYRGITGTYAEAFAHIDDQIYLFPAPSSGTYKLYYRHQPTDLSSYADGQFVDLVCPAGEAFMSWGVAALMLGKGEKDVRFALQQKEAARTRLQWEASQKSSETQSAYSDPDNPPPTPGDWWPNR